MDEYIKRDAIKYELWASSPACELLMVVRKKTIDSIPAADVAPVRHGRWFFKSPNGWACSQCDKWGLMIDNRGICKSSYCPNCGAKMDLEEQT